jgi:hypothetical protein
MIDLWLMEISANRMAKSKHIREKKIEIFGNYCIRFIFQLLKMTIELPRVSVQDVLNCSFTNWYPLFAKHSIKR